MKLTTAQLTTVQPMTEQPKLKPEVFLEQAFRELYEEFTDKFPDIDTRDYFDIIENLNTDLFYFNQT